MPNLARIFVCLWSGLPLAASGSDFSPLRSYLAEAVDDGVVAGGAVLVIHRGKPVFESGFGFANLEAKVPFEVDTPVVIASISKPLLGTAAFRISQAGQLDLGEPISTYLPEFSELVLESGERASRAPTMVELFTHTSGLRNDESPGGRPWFAGWTKGKTLEEVVRGYAENFPLKAPPGIRYAYSGIGTDVAARVAEVASGSSRNDLLRETVCRPLGMSHTYYWNTADRSERLIMPKRYFRDEQSGKLRLSNKRRQVPADEYTASGGTIISTAGDLSRWLLMLRNGGEHGGQAFLDPELLGKLLSGTGLGRNSQGGFFIRKRDADGQALVVGHTGSSGTNCWIDLETDTIGIMLTQTRGRDIRKFRLEVEKWVEKCIGAAPDAQ